MKKKSIMLFGAICAISLGAAVFTACSPEVTPEHKHRVIDREAVAATCSTEGNVAYQECLYCGALFLNGEEVTKEKVTIPSDPSLHVLVHHAEVQATCLKNGNVNYYECTVCGNAFSDETALTPVEETVVYGKHILKTVEAGEATCYSKAHVQHYVCEYCHQVVKGEEVTNENKSSLGEVYSGQMLKHNFVGGVCTNTGCGAQQVNATVSSVTVGTDAVDVTSKALTTPGSWQALKGETDTATVTAANDAMTVNLASDSAVRLVNVPAKANAAFVGVYELSFNLKVENYKAEDTEKTLRIGFSLRTSAGTGNGDIVNYAATIRKTEENGVYNIKLFVEAATADQLLQIEIANTGAANTDKTVVLSDIMYTFYPEAAKTFVNRLEVNLPATMPEAISYNVGRINTDGEATKKVPLGQWRYYQANSSRKKGAKVSGKGFGNGMSITFSGYFGKKNTERLYYRPNVPVGSKVTVTFNLSMSMDGIIAVSQPSAASYNMKANEPQTITITYTVSSSNYIRLDLTINDVQNSNFPEGGSCTIDITGVTCKI